MLDSPFDIIDIADLLIDLLARPRLRKFLLILLSIAVIGLAMFAVNHFYG